MGQVLTASSGWRQGMLLSILQCTKQPSLPSTKNDQVPKSNRAKVEEPCSSLNLQLACSCQCLLSAPCQKSKVLNLIKDQSHLPPRPLEPNTFFLISVLGFPGGSVVKKKICLPRLESQVQSLGWEDPLEKEMATYSSILAWEIP